MNTLMLLLALSLGSVEGIVTTDGSPLPGATVTLTGERNATTSTNIEGKYRFENVTQGSYSVQAGIKRRRAVGTAAIEVREGDHSLAAIDLKFETVETVTTSCNPCSANAPDSVYDFPTCTDFFFDENLIAAIEGEDRSAIALAEQRFATAATLRQKISLAGALLGNAANDKPYWYILHEHASIAVRFATTEDEPSEEYRAWCAERDLDVDRYPQIAHRALWEITNDPRARDLLTRAVESDDVYVVSVAIVGLAEQKDFSALPLIDRALTRFPEDAAMLAEGLVMYGTAEADQLAFKYLDETQRESYRQLRAELHP